MRKTTVTSLSGMLTAILASLCCIAPVLLLLAGFGTVDAFSILVPYRPFLIGISMVFMGLALFFIYRRRTVTCADGTCRVETAGLWAKTGVWSAAIIAVGAIAFPYFGVTALSSPRGEAVMRTPDLAQNVTFFSVPLVCNAAPHIGCGSRAKFIMLDLMKRDAVKEAWLNRKGTVMAVVWNKGTSAASRQTDLASVFSSHNVSVEQVSKTEQVTLARTFHDKGKWYRGSDVDSLSIEEAGVMADRILAGLDSVDPPVVFKRNEDRQAFREDVKTIIQNRFLSLTSFSDLNDSAYHRIEREVLATGEKYLGKGNMPELEIRHNDGALGKNAAGCCTDEQGNQ